MDFSTAALSSLPLPLPLPPPSSLGSGYWSINCNFCLQYTVQYSTIKYCCMLCCTGTILLCAVQYCCVLYNIAVCCTSTILLCAVHCTILLSVVHYTAVCYTLLFNTAHYCFVLYTVALNWSSLTVYWTFLWTVTWYYCVQFILYSTMLFFTYEYAL